MMNYEMKQMKIHEVHHIAYRRVYLQTSVTPGVHLLASEGLLLPQTSDRRVQAMMYPV